MMDLTKRNIIKTFTVFFVVISLFSVWCLKVDAATLHANTKKSNRIYYGSGGDYTYYNKKIDKAVAYCTQLHKKIGIESGNSSGSASGYKNKWDPLDYKALVSGEIIRLSGGTDGKNSKSEYKKIQERLNCYLKYSGYYKGGCSSSNKKVISEAKSNVNKYGSGRSSKKLPTLTFSGNKTLSFAGKTGYYKSSAITLSGLVKSYGGDETSYTISVDGSGYICNSDDVNVSNVTSSCEKSKTVSNSDSDQVIYVYVASGGTDGGKIKITASGSNSSTYHSARLWKKSGKVQSLVTYRKITVNRSVSTTYTVTYPKVNNYSASLEKVDQNGNGLLGAELTLFTSSTEDGTGDRKEICKITGSNTECSKSDLITSDDTYKYSDGRYLCYEETKAPDGYVKRSVDCHKISIGNSSKIYRDSALEDSDISEDLYNKYLFAIGNSGGNYCVYSIDPNVTEITDDYINTQISSGTSGLIVSGKDMCPTSVTSGEQNAEVKATKNICMYAQNSYYKYGGDDDAAATDICGRDHQLSVFENTSGSISIQATNILNSVNISKKAITGDDEVPGATLAIYTTDDKGQCTNELARSNSFDYQPYDPPVVSDDSPSENGDASVEEESGGDDGEEDVVAEDEVSADDDYKDVDPAKDGLKWESSYTPATIYGLKSGKYCLVEEVAPLGYKKATTTTKFEIDDNNNVLLVEAGSASLNKVENFSDTIVLHDELTKMSISKTDIATSKELPGAKLSICESAVDDNSKDTNLIVGNNGDCTVVSLYNGEPATWTSGTSPHEIIGLPAGTYYLVEVVSPNGYDTAESILFTMNEDGTLVDKDGKSLVDNKIVMKDKSLTQTKTGQLKIILVCAIVLISGIVAFFTNRKRSSVGESKLRRKLHFK